MFQRSFVNNIPATGDARAATKRDNTTPASPSQIFELIRMGSNQYHLHPTLTQGFLPSLEGVFAFVILASAPGRIYCGLLEGADPQARTDKAFRIHGHTSLSHHEDVLFAGELLLKNGRLENWNNCSGHYRPAAALRYSNFIPHVKRLLPDHLFIDQREMTHKLRQTRLAARGYMTLI